MTRIDNVEDAFLTIDWSSLDVGRVFAFYDAAGRPADQRALLMAPIDPEQRAAWQRQCVVDLAAMRGRDCPSCTA